MNKKNKIIGCASDGKGGFSYFSEEDFKKKFKKVPEKKAKRILIEFNNAVKNKKYRTV